MVGDFYAMIQEQEHSEIEHDKKVRSFLLGLKREDKSIQLIGACGNLSDSLKEEL